MSYLSLFVMMIITIIAFIFITTNVISRMLDKKIGDIRVNVPKINVQPPNVFIRVPPKPGYTLSETPPSTKKQPSHQPKLTHPNSIQLYEPFLSVNFDDEREGKKGDSVTEGEAVILVDTKTPPTMPTIAIGCTKDADCNVVNGNGLNVCKIDGTCSCIGGGSGQFCHYGPVNYRDPKDMTAEERHRFKSTYRENMTLQDYKNWLMLYKTDPDRLWEVHRKNLSILMRGGQLTTKDIPSTRIKPPTEAAEYFQKMYKNGNIAVTFPEYSGPYVGANYGKYDSFEPPSNESSNITGIVDAYKMTGKDDAKSVDWYMRPLVTVGVEEQRAGDIYQNFVEKRQTFTDASLIFDTSPNPNTYIPREQTLRTFGQSNRCNEF